MRFAERTSRPPDSAARAPPLGRHEPHVTGDTARLQQVLWNLIKNAVKFTPAGGNLTVRTHNGDREGGPAGGRLVVEVADTGVGITPGMLPRIFDAFEQGDESPWTRRSAGLGLGLAISRSVIEAHGGRVTATSRPRSGNDLHIRSGDGPSIFRSA